MRRHPARRRARAALAATTALLGLLAGCTVPAPTPETLSRSIGGPPALDPEALHLEQRIAVMTLPEKVASLVMIHVPGTDPAAIRAAVEAHGFGGIILMGDNIAGDASGTARATEQLSSDSTLPILTAIDQEGGVVRRLPADRFAAGVGLWGSNDAEVEAVFRERARLVAQAGVLVNFGIVADVAFDSSSFIIDRTLGASPEVAARHVAAAVRGESGLALSTLKHFPGHGASPDDSHVGIPRSSIDLVTWRATHAVPFAAGIAAGAPVVMMGHLRFDRVSPLPASLSPTWVRILRGELGFEGLVVTDDLLMLQRSGDATYADPIENGVRALAAGNDLLLYVLPADPGTVGFDGGALVAALVAAVGSGRIAETAVDDSLRRVLAARRAASGEPGPFIDCGPKCRGESPRSHPTAAETVRDTLTHRWGPRFALIDGIPHDEER